MQVAVRWVLRRGSRVKVDVHGECTGGTAVGRWWWEEGRRVGQGQCVPTQTPAAEASDRVAARQNCLQMPLAAGRAGP